MALPTPRQTRPVINYRTIEKSQNSALIKRLEAVYDSKTVHKIAVSHNLTAVQTSLGETLRSGGTLYLQYGRSNANTAHDLAPKIRAVARAAEIARNLSSELANLDFWDRWKIFEQLQNTGHPLADHLDNHAIANPLTAGNLIFEEIQLVLDAVTRFETNFFETLTHNTDGKTDLGLYFFVQVVGEFWKSLTGKTAVNRIPAHILRRTQASGVSSEAFTFLSDCIEPLAPVQEDELTLVIQSALL